MIKKYIFSKEGVLELVATILSLLYTLLYSQGKPMAFLFGFLGSALFVNICFRKKIFAEAALYIFYVGMAVWGYLNQDGGWEIIHKPLSFHLKVIPLAVILMVLTALFLKKKTNGQTVWLDAFTTSFSILATFLMIFFIHENWLYWIVINAVTIFLYLKRQLYFGALLFLFYLLIAVNGYFEIF